MQQTQELLEYCLRGERWPDELLRQVLFDATSEHPDRAAAASKAFFGTVIERLSDSFEPALCEVYASLFSEAIEFVLPEYRARELRERYQRVRQPRPFHGDRNRVRNVMVLSRVTLGADVAITSVMLDAVKKAFPVAEIHLAGSRKAWELFAGDPRVRHLDIAYARASTLRDRLAASARLRPLLQRPATIVVDPDSRLTQLGLVPVCAEEDYYFFESRSYGGDGADPLPVLARRWCRETFGVEDAGAFIAPAEGGEQAPEADVSMSLGVGENPAKRVPDPFEENLARDVLLRGARVLIDKGAPGEETERVERIAAACRDFNGQLLTWQGAFAPFARSIAGSGLYIGYDSAGQHVAAACGVPLVSVFAGYASPRTFQRWRAAGPGPIEVVRVEDARPEKVLKEVLDAIARLPAGFAPAAAR